MNIRILKITVFLFFAINLNAQNQKLENNVLDNGPGSYKILVSENNPVKIPFKMHNGKPLMELEINGKKANLMIDNGVLWDEVWLFGTPLVKELNLKPVETSSNDEDNDENPFGLYVTKEIELAFEDIIFSMQPVLVSPPSTGITRMFPGVDGQLCNTFFKHFVVEFDFVKNEILLHNPEKYSYNGNGCTLNMRLTESGTYSIFFQIEMKDGQVFKNRADIDFGGIYAFKAALNTELELKIPTNAVKRPFMGGTEYIANIKSMTIGDYKFDHPKVIFGDEKTSRIHPKNLGVIGLPLFMKFKTIFDYFNNKIYLEPNSKFNGKRL